MEHVRSGGGGNGSTRQGWASPCFRESVVRDELSRKRIETGIRSGGMLENEAYLLQYEIIVVMSRPVEKSARAILGGTSRDIVA